MGVWMQYAYTHRQGVGRKYKLLHFISLRPLSCYPRALYKQKAIYNINAYFFFFFWSLKLLYCQIHPNPAKLKWLRPFPVEASLLMLSGMPARYHKRDEVIALILKAISLGASSWLTVPARGSSPLRESFSFLCGGDDISPFPAPSGFMQGATASISATWEKIDCPFSLFPSEVPGQAMQHVWNWRGMRMPWILLFVLLLRLCSTELCTVINRM